MRIHPYLQRLVDEQEKKKPSPPYYGETVYDYNPTQEEMEELSFLEKEMYIKLGKEAAMMGLFTLFSWRGQKEKANYYFNQLPKKTQEPFLMQDLLDDDIEN